jgi:hypothetical protein
MYMLAALALFWLLGLAAGLCAAVLWAALAAGGGDELHKTITAKVGGYEGGKTESTGR